MFLFCCLKAQNEKAEHKSSHYSHQMLFLPLGFCFLGFGFFFFGQATNFILSFLNADVRSVSCKWSIYSVSASCTGRSRDVQAMSLPRKSGGRVLWCFPRERSDSSKSAVTPGRGWCLCECRGELVRAGAEGRVGDPRECVHRRGEGARVIPCETYFFCFHFKCCRCSFPGF